MNRVQAQYIARRKKEDLSFMVIRFMKAYVLFDDIYAEFKRLQQSENKFERSLLFQKVKDLEEKLVFDIKEKAHFLFRSGSPDEADSADLSGRLADLERILLTGRDRLSDRQQARQIFSSLRKSLVSKSIDSYVGTGFHLFMILRESVYQLEFYVPQYLQEMEHLDRIEQLSRSVGYVPDEEEEHELEHIRQVVRLCQSIASDTKELAAIALERCKSLFKETAEIIRHSVEESGANEVLVLNLLKEQELVSRVYGPGSCQALMDHMFRAEGESGQSGMEKAVEFVKRTCGNVQALDL